MLRIMTRTFKQLTFTDHRMKTGHGGPRPNAGRPLGPRPRVLHRERDAVPNGCPIHVTLRVQPGLPSLRSARMIRGFRRSLSRACERGSFRVVHYSLQNDHAHLIVEASGKRALACGMKSVGARLARVANRVFERKGSVLDGRYHSVVLRSPNQVRNALRYVLLNGRKHAKRVSRELRLDPASSGRWFDGWKRSKAEAADPVGGVREVARARSWLLAKGWRRHGLIDWAEVPGAG